MFKVGDEVKVVGNNTGHMFTVGDCYSISVVEDFELSNETAWPWVYGITARHPQHGVITQWFYQEDLELAGDSMNTYKQSGDNSGKMKAIMKGFAAKEKVVEDVEPKRKKIHIDSRNPQRYNFKVATVHVKSFGETEVVAPVKCADGEYVLHAEYEKLKNKLCKMERKYAKLQRRHNRVGLKLLKVMNATGWRAIKELSLFIKGQ